MNVTMLASGMITWLFLSTSYASQVSSAENDNIDPLDLNSVTKLVEHLTKMSDQLNQLSNQLTDVSDKQTKQSDHLSKQSSQLKEMSSRLDKLEEESSAGPTFTRWGRRSCNGTNSEMVYLGVAAGTGVGASGGGASLLCLARNPTFGNYDGFSTLGSEATAAEYILDPATNFPFEHNDPLLLNNNVPCAVCEVTNGYSVMMIPGRVDCYSDWRMEYRGYLMTADYDTPRIEYVCVDANPEPVDGGGGPGSYSVGLYPVRADCEIGALPCPPYGEDWELACVVCSK